MNIRQANVDDIPVLVDLIRRSFKDVAERFGLTKDNCPTHPSFYTTERITSDFEKNIQYYLLEADSLPVGCMALEKATEDICYLERLGVLPEKRRNGFGNALVQRVFEDAGSLGAKQISIGIIADHETLKSWYKNIGFKEMETKTFKHLPFRVTFMIYSLHDD